MSMSRRPIVKCKRQMAQAKHQTVRAEKSLKTNHQVSVVEQNVSVRRF